jgi:hypothetical protein
MASTNNIGASSSGTWGTNNRAVYCPIVIDEPFLVQKVALYNGSTASGNVDVGIYSENGTRIWSVGGVAQSGTNVMQVFTPTAFVLPPGRYYIGVAFSSSAGTITGRLFINEIARMCGVGIQATAYPLPSSFTIAVAPTALRYPQVALSGQSVI